jgi:hypothetical protein
MPEVQQLNGFTSASPRVSYVCLTKSNASEILWVHTVLLQSICVDNVQLLSYVILHIKIFIKYIWLRPFSDTARYLSNSEASLPI